MKLNDIYAVIGSRGTGKTPFIMGGDEEQGLAKIFLQKGMSVLILDTLNHHKYGHIPTLHPKDYSLTSDKIGIYRTLANVDNINRIIEFHLSKVWNTFIVFEDAYKYTGTKFEQSMRTVIGDSKQQNNELLYMYSCWAWTPIDLVRQANYFIVFKTADGPECRAGNLGGCLNDVREAHATVMRGEKRYVTVDSGI